MSSGALEGWFHWTSEVGGGRQVVEDWAGKMWELFKSVAPWLTGGLAGAILTYLLNQRVIRRRQAKILITIERVDYSLAARDEQLKELRVSYRGNEFDNLLLFQFLVKNISTKSVSCSPFLFQFKKDAAIVDLVTVTHPLRREVAMVRQQGHDNAYIWDTGELKPQDSARLSMLLAPTTHVDWDWRGEDDVETTSYGQETTRSFEKELRDIVLWTSLYIAAGSIPFMGNLFQALLILVSIPSIVSYIIRWLPILGAWATPRVHVDTGSHSNIALVVGSGSTLLSTNSDEAKAIAVDR
jgi:hypothetical protein